MSLKLKPYPQPKRPIFAQPDGIALGEWSKRTGIKRTTLLMQIKKQYWKLRGPNGGKLIDESGGDIPGVMKVEGRWRFHDIAFLEFPERKEWGTVNKHKKVAKRGYPRDAERKVGKRKIIG